MPRVSISIAGIIFAAMLAAPGSAAAGIIDFIYEMSGPQMWGIPIQCDVDLRSLPAKSADGTPRNYQCRFIEKHLGGERLFRTAEDRWLWVSIGGGVYTSTTKDSRPNIFDAWKIGMVAYEPMLHIRSVQSPGSTRSRFAIEHGAIGFSHMLFVGKGFEPFDNIGIKFMPLQVRYRRVSVGYTMRVFPKGFTSPQFGGPPSRSTQGAEVVNGILGTWFWSDY